MNINLKNQSQFELFPGTSGTSNSSGKVPRLTKDLTLSLENIIVLCIIFVMVLVLFFSFGVEKGKRIALVNDGSGNANLARGAQKKEKNSPVEPVTQAQKEERVVLPVSVPELLKESEPDFQPPVEKNSEQEKLFTIQVASFKLEKNAQKEADLLKGKGHDDAFVVPKGGHSIVCIGKFSQKNEAKKVSNKLKNRYNDCLVRSL